MLTGTAAVVARTVIVTLGLLLSHPFLIAATICYGGALTLTTNRGAVTLGANRRGALAASRAGTKTVAATARCHSRGTQGQNQGPRRQQTHCFFFNTHIKFLTFI